MSRELELVSLVLETGDLTLIREHGITPQKLVGSPEAQMLLQMILDYAAEPAHGGRPPSRVTVQRRFKNVELPPVDGLEMSDLISKVDSNYLASRVNAMLSQSNTIALQQGIKQAVQYIAAEAGKLLREGGSREDIIFEAAAEQMIMDEYARILSTDGLPGIPWPWEILNEHTQGVLPEQFYVFYGLTKAMKTWVVLAIIEHITRVSDARVLVYIKEMPKLEVIQRLALLRAKINDRKFNKGKLEPEELDRLRDSMSDMRKKFSDDPRKGQIILAGANEHLSPEGLRALIRRWGVQGFFADSMYLMADDRTKGSRSTLWTSVGNVSGDLRDITQQENVWGMVTTQEHERSGKQYGRTGTASAGYAHKIIEDATMCFHIFKFLDPKTKLPEIGFDFPGTRKFDVPQFTIHAIPAENFGFKRRGMRDPKTEEGQERGVPQDMSGLSSEEAITDGLDTQAAFIQLARQDNKVVN